MELLKCFFNFYLIHTCTHQLHHWGLMTLLMIVLFILHTQNDSTNKQELPGEQLGGRDSV